MSNETRAGEAQPWSASSNDERLWELALSSSDAEWLRIERELNAGVLAVSVNQEWEELSCGTLE